MQRRLVVDDLFDVDGVEITLVYRIERQRHLGHRQRRVLLLLHELHDSRPAFELVAGRCVEIGRKLRERRQLTVLGECEPNTAAELLDDLGLRGTADSRDGQAGVDGRAHAGIEQIRLQEDLAVGDRDHVRGYESRHVTGLRLDDRQRRQRTGLALDLAARYLFDVRRVDPGSTLEQTRMQVEDVSRIGFAARRSPE